MNKVENYMQRKIELGVLVTLCLSVISFAFWLGGLNSKVNTLDSKVNTLDPGRITTALEQAGNLPKGTVSAWFSSSGAVPKGWAICDGSPGTPDLRGRFLRGVGNTGDVGKLGGTDPHAETTTVNAVKHRNRGNGDGAVCEGKCYDTDVTVPLPSYCTVIFIIKQF